MIQFLVAVGNVLGRTAFAVAESARHHVNLFAVLVIEEEFANTLKVMSREANTLSPTIRQAWDSGLLRTMTKNNAAKATDANISVVGHITRDELRRNLCETEQTNGFGNRFLWVCVERSKFLPDGGNLRDEDLEPIRHHVREAVLFAATAGKLDRDADARKLWHEVYPRLSGDRFGLLGSMTGRAEAQVLRLSVLYAVLDMSRVVKVEHLKAALAIWNYCGRSAEYVFGNSLGNRDADKLLAELRHVADMGLTRTEMLHNVFHKNETAGDIADALRLLHDNGLAHRQDDLDPENGRGAERWFATGTT